MSASQLRELDGLKALVTGATAGLGRAIAFQLAREGAEVVVHGRDAARGAQIVEAIRGEGGRARFVAAFAPRMIARGTGSIINISSIAARVGLVGAAVYGATKAALESMGRAWTAEFSSMGVRVNTITSGPIYTRPEERELYDTVGATTAMKRAAEPEEIAEVVAFLASPRASYVTGANVAADGGRTAI